jgi:hypothetical protein
MAAKRGLVALVLLLWSPLWAGRISAAPQREVEETFARWHQELGDAADKALASTKDTGKPPDIPFASSRMQLQPIDLPKPGGAAARRVQSLRPTIEPVLREEGIPPEFSAIVLVESGGNATALSPKGARGLWQLMPDTARRYGLTVERSHDDRIDLEKSTRAAARYLRDLHGQFKSWPIALAAYNAGEQAVQKAINRAGDNEFVVLSSRRLLPAETRNYVPAVINLIEGPEGLGNPPEQARRRSGEERIVYALQGIGDFQ